MERRFYRFNDGALRTEHRGAPFTVDGVHYMNAGDRAERAVKIALGYDERKDANTAFDAGSDIPELCASVKSSKSTLTSARIGDSFEAILRAYFARTASTLWIWAVQEEGALTIYMMNRYEFEAFTRSFASMQCGVIRYKYTSSKMIRWLDERATER